MSLIITATDFSEVATNAVHYACGLAKARNANLVVVHSFIIPVTFTDNPMPAMPIEEGKQIAEEQMSRLLDGLKTQYPGIDISGHITFGDITDSLQEYTEEVRPDLIVVGNSSSEDSIFWPGSNLLSELRNLPYTVIAVPQSSRFTPVKNICFACDYKNITEQLPAQELIELALQNNAQLHVLNIHTTSTAATEPPQNTELLKRLLAPANPTYHFADSEDVDQGIQNFITANGMNWLVVVPHKHSFFEGLFHKSHTKAMARIAHVPLVALHER